MFAVKESVKDYYGKVLTTKKDLKTSACTSAAPPSLPIARILSKVPDEVMIKYYGCGNPVPLGIDGLNVLDLGCGSGRDVYVASALVGEHGKVTGVDMTEEQLAVARRNVPEFLKKVGYSKSNMDFKLGYIEDLLGSGVPPKSQDIVISNCVVNLSPDKYAVIKATYDVLKDGGELCFSDVYCDRRLPEAITKHEVLWGECIAGALYIEDFKRICHKVGFTDPRQMSTSEISITDPVLKDLLGEAKFYSITYRCFKFPEGVLETLCEDYGQVAIYKGTIPTHAHSYILDDHHKFVTGKPMLVCGNTAAMVGQSWLKAHFTIIGDRSKHYGLFDCSTPVATSSVKAEESSCGPSGCGPSGGCSGGGCC